jgi:hypothetical protein
MLIIIISEAAREVRIFGLPEVQTLLSVEVESCLKPDSTLRNPGLMDTLFLF